MAFETKIWSLLIEGKRVGKFQYEYIDQPVMHGTFYPQPEFATYQELFHEEAKLLEESGGTDWGLLSDAIDKLDIALVAEKSSDLLVPLGLHINTENEAWFRF